MKEGVVMTWTNTDNMIEHLQLLMEQIVEYGKWRIGSFPIDEDNSEEYEYRKKPSESEFERLGYLYCNWSVIKAVRELESYFMVDDDKKNVRHFNLWRNKLKLGLEIDERQTILEVLKEKDAYSYLGGSVDIDMIEYAAAHSEWAEHDYLKLTSLLLVDLFTLLHKTTQKLLDLYGIDETADFIFDIIRPNPVVKEDTYKKTSSEDKATREESSFYNIILYSDKDKLVKRLHQLIDGNKGAYVGSVLYKADKKRYIRNIPTQDEFESEFRLVGSWQAIYNYAKPNMNNDNKLQNAIKKAEDVIIFEGENN